MASFFSFFRQTTELIAYVQRFTETDKFTQAKFDQCKLTPKGPPFQFFFGNVRIFFRKFLMSQKSPPFGFFDILQQKVCQ